MSSKPTTKRTAAPGTVKNSSKARGIAPAIHGVSASWPGHTVLELPVQPRRLAEASPKPEISRGRSASATQIAAHFNTPSRTQAPKLRRKVAVLSIGSDDDHRGHACCHAMSRYSKLNASLKALWS